jgi:phosphoribosylformylglycinamidine (FGAM) synthase PurS component
VKAVVKIDLEASSGQVAQRVLFDLCDKMKQEGVIRNYSFEIESPDGMITDRCVLAEGKVIA